MPGKKSVISTMYYTGIALYFGIVFFWILIFVNPEQSYYIQQPGFFFGVAYLSKFLQYPGGLTDYFCLFLSQFFYYPLVGASIISIIALTAYMFSRKIVELLNVKYCIVLIQLIPVTAMISLHSFSTGIISTSMILLSVVAAFYLYIKVTFFKYHIRIAVYLILSSAIYYLAGGGGMLIFQALCLAFECVKLQGKKSIPVIVTILFSALVPYVAARFVFFITLKQSYLHMLVPDRPFKPTIIQYVLYCYYPLLIIFNRFLQNINKNEINSNHNNGISLGVQFLLTGIITLVLLKYSVQSEEQFGSRIKYLAHKGKWNEILELTAKHSSNDRLVNFYVNKALYFTGRLPYDLFRHENFWGQHALFLGGYTFGSVAMDNSELFFDLGHIRAARQWAYEAQTVDEFSPRVLSMLALTNIIERDYKAAVVVLKILQRSIIYKNWAQYYLKGIQDTISFHSDSLVQKKRRMMPSDVHFMDGRKVEVDLFALLKKNPDNRMAFEYLMAYLMLSDQIEKITFSELISHLNRMGYKEIPQTYQEALMVYLNRKKDYVSEVGKYEISQFVLDGYSDYLGTLNAYGMNLAAARENLYYKYGLSYWYYLNYLSPYINDKGFLEKMVKHE